MSLAGPKHSIWMFATKNDIPLIIFASSLMVISALAPPLQSYVYGKAFGKLTVYLSGGFARLESFIKEIRIYCGYIMILGGAKMVITWISIYMWLLVGEKQQSRARKQIFHLLLKRDLEWFESKQNLMGSLSQVNRCVEEIRSGVSENIGLLVQNTATIVFLFISAMISLWSLTLIVMASAPFMAASSWYFGRITLRAASEENDVSAGASKVLDWSFVSGDLVRTLNGQFHDMVKFNRIVDASAKAFIRMSVAIAANSSTLRMLSNLIFVQAFWFGDYLIKSGKLDISLVFTAFSSCLLLGMQVSEMADIFALINKAQASALTIGEFLSLEQGDHEVEQEPEKSSEISNYDITMENVGFTYKNSAEATLLEVITTFDLNFTCITGKSGSGKSTLALLLMGFYRPTSGKICIGGMDLDNLSSQWVGENMTLVELSPLVFEGLLLENISLGCESVSEAKVLTACTFARLDSLVQRLPQGIHSHLASSTLSGGQIQKIGLARAWIKNTPILILDEAMSAIDSTTRKELFRALRESRRGKMTIVVTHDILEINENDSLLILQSGKVKAQGVAKNLGPYSYQSSADPKPVGKRSSVTTVPVRSRRSVYDYLHNPVILKDLEENASTNDDTLQVLGIFSILKYCYHTITKRWIIVMGLSMSLVGGFMTPVISFGVSKLLANLVNTSQESYRSKNTTLLWSLVVTGLSVADGLVYFVSRSSLQYALEMWVVELRKLAFSIIDDQDMSFFFTSHLKPAELTALIMNDSRDLRNLVSEFLADALLMVSMTLLGTIWAIVSGWKLALVGISFVFLALLISVIYGFLLLKFESRYKDTAAEIENFNHNVISGIKTVKAFGLRSKFEDDFDHKLQDLAKVGQLRAISTGCGFALLELCTSVSTGTILYYGMVLVAHETYSQSEMLQVLSLLTFTLSSASSIIHQLPEITRGQRAGTLFVKLLELTPQFVEANVAGSINYIKNGAPLLRFKNVDFSYPNLETKSYHKVLDNLNLTIYKGETVAIVGESGSGKSTIALLLARLYQPDRGLIELCGQPVAHYDSDWYRSTVSFVAQYPRFFSGSIIDNLCYGMDGQVTEERLVECLKDCNVLSFIASLPNGVHTDIGEGVHSQVSLGQLQRLCIARALLRRPKILILDECNSNLDSYNAKAITKLICSGLRKSRPDMTVVVITHDNDLMMSSSRVLVLESGKIVEDRRRYKGDVNRIDKE